MKTIMAGGAAKLQLSKSVQGLIGQVLLEDQLTKLYQLHMTNAYTCLWNHTNEMYWSLRRTEVHGT